MVKGLGGIKIKTLDARKDKKLKERQFWYIIGFAMGFLFFGIFAYDAAHHLFITRNHPLAIFYCILAGSLMASIGVFACLLDRFLARVIFRERGWGEVPA